MFANVSAQDLITGCYGSVKSCIKAALEQKPLSNRSRTFATACLQKNRSRIIATACNHYYDTSLHVLYGKSCTEHRDAEWLHACHALCKLLKSTAAACKPVLYRSQSEKVEKEHISLGFYTRLYGLTYTIVIHSGTAL